MYGDVELPPEVLKDLAEAFLGAPAAPEGEAEEACGAQLPWASLPALGKDVFPDYLGFEQARSSRLHQDHQASAWRPLAQQDHGGTGRACKRHGLGLFSGTVRASIRAYGRPHAPHVLALPPPLLPYWAQTRRLWPA